MKGFHLETAGIAHEAERNPGHERTGREQAGDQEQGGFGQQDQLLERGRFLEPSAQLTGGQEASHIGKYGQQEREDFPEAAGSQYVAGIDDVPGLGEGEHAAPGQETVGGGKTAGHRHQDQHGPGVCQQAPAHSFFFCLYHLDVGTGCHDGSSFL